MTARAELPPILERIQLPALLVGILGAAAAAAGPWLASPEQFFRSYLVSYLFWVGLALGSLALLMLQHITGGMWALVIRRVLECGARMLPFMALLFLPLLLGMDHLYVWTGDTHARGVGVSPLRAWYLRPGFFAVRAAVYFLVWIALAGLLDRWSGEEDRTGGDLRLARRFQRLSGGGLVLLGLTVTFAAVDWAMSLTPQWYSTIYGAIFLVGHGLGALAWAILLAAALGRRPPLSTVARDDRFHDLGNLLLAFVMLWAYVSFSQFLIIWSADLAEEAPYYLYRTHGGWQWLALVLITCHFFLPFLLLLSRSTKRSRAALAVVAAAVLLLRPVDLFWTVVPSWAQGRGAAEAPLRVHWLDFTVCLGMGGLWVALFIHQLRRRPLLAPHDARLEDAAASHG